MISVVVPVYNEAENAVPLLEEIAALAVALPLGEIIFVDDASSDTTAASLLEAKKKHPLLRLLRHEKRSGQSAALHTGILHAKGDVIVTLDGDGQNNPADIGALYAAYEKEGRKGMVAGQRQKRQDSAVKRYSSRIANGIRSGLLGDGVPDTGCGLKLFTREDFLALPYFNHMHRFLPALMKRNDVDIIMVDVSHRPRTKGVSKYGTLDRLWAGIFDLFGVLWLQKRAKTISKVTEE